MEKVSYRTTMPFDGGLTPPSKRSRGAPLFGDTPQISDILEGELGKIIDIHGRGNWGEGKDDGTSYGERGDEFRMDERIRSVLSDPEGRGKSESWQVETYDGKTKTFQSYDAAVGWIQKKKIPYRALRRKFASSDKAVINYALAACGTISSSSDEGHELGACFHMGDGVWVTCAHCVRSYERGSPLSDSPWFDADITISREGMGDFKGSLISVDLNYDVATIKGPDTGGHLSIGSSEDSTVGTGVVAIGNPQGYENNVSEGIVSGIDRKVFYEEDSPLYTFTDAQVMPGNSGGPLVSLENGRVIGMMCIILPAEGIYGLNAALPAEYLSKVVKTD